MTTDRAVKLVRQIWTQSADHHTGQRLLTMPQSKAGQKTALDRMTKRDKKLLASRAATTEVGSPSVLLANSPFSNEVTTRLLLKQQSEFNQPEIAKIATQGDDLERRQVAAARDDVGFGEPKPIATVVTSERFSENHRRPTASAVDGKFDSEFQSMLRLDARVRIHDHGSIGAGLHCVAGNR